MRWLSDGLVGAFHDPAGAGRSAAGRVCAEQQARVPRGAAIQLFIISLVGVCTGCDVGGILPIAAFVPSAAPAPTEPQLFDATVFLVFDESLSGALNGAANTRSSVTLSEASRHLVRRRLESEFGPYGLRFVEGSWQECGAAKLAIAFRGFSGTYYGTAGAPAPLAIVYVDTIHGSCCGLLSPPGEFEQWLADVAGHELGHLLGYKHVADRSDIMSTGWNRGTKGDVRFKPLAQKPNQATRTDICVLGAAGDGAIERP